MPCIVQLRGQPNLATWHARLLDSLSDLLFICVCESCINVTISFLQGDFHRIGDFIWLALPSSKADSGDFSSRVEGEGLSVKLCISNRFV